MKKLKYKIRNIFKKFGIDIAPYDFRHSIQNYLSYLILKNDINEIWDIGANCGQYAEMLRNIGYRKKIISIEALPMESEILSQKAKNDDNWLVYGNLAIDITQGRKPFFCTQDSVSSSLLLPEKSKVKDKIFVASKRLDSLLINSVIKQKMILKMDVQGSEYRVIESCGKELYLFDFIQLEASIKTLYKDEKDYIQIIKILEKKGYKPIFFYPGIPNKLGELLQIEIIFTKEK